VVPTDSAYLLVIVLALAAGLIGVGFKTFLDRPAAEPWRQRAIGFDSGIG
jgi:hypothetical protein